MGHELPDSAPTFDELCDRAPAPESVAIPQDCIGGITVHVCYPKVLQSVIAVGERNPDRVQRGLGLIHYTDGRSVDTVSAVAWNRHMMALTLRSGPADECPVCMGEADPAAMIDQIIDHYVECSIEPDPVVKRREQEVMYGYDARYVVYVDTGLTSNSTRGFGTIVANNPYIDMVNASEVFGSANSLDIDDTLRVELGCRYPDTMPGCPL